ncbi:hypothetical protein EXA22_10490, partial [Vibrio cincinnatiensis]|nr:hypothetical protein [Vibrio cincinnatiensis]
LFLVKQIITLYHAAQKSITKDQHALDTQRLFLFTLNRAHLRWCLWTKNYLHANCTLSECML